MAHNTIFRPESSEPDKSRSAPVAGDRGGRADAEAPLTRWQSILSAHGGGAVSADLALDLVLNEIVEVTRESTRASAAAIALARDGEMVCRATTGDGAPGLGARLSGDTGLSAACVQSGNWQICRDSEHDPRVDSEFCRTLGVRSILVVPVLRTGELLGVLEIFSAQAGAFGEREVRTLQMLSRSIVENIELARQAARQDKEEALREFIAEGGKPPAELDSAEVKAELREGKETADFWTGALMVAVVILAVTLGWMVGRGARQERKAGLQGHPLSASQGAGNGAMAGLTSPFVRPPGRASGSDLIVYQDGKMVFPKPAQTGDTQRHSTAAGPVKAAVESSKIETAAPVQIPPEVAAGLVTQRVEPEYPEHARERKIQGAVVLDAVIGKDGAVQKFTGIQGDPELAAAASAAVRQWRFKPLVRDGESEDFQTRVTVVFRLP